MYQRVRHKQVWAHPVRDLALDLNLHALEATMALMLEEKKARGLVMRMRIEMGVREGKGRLRRATMRGGRGERDCVE